MIKMRKNRRRIQETGASWWEARGHAQLWKRMSSIPGKTGFQALHLSGICKSDHGVFSIFSHSLIVAATIMCIANLSSRERDWRRAPELLCSESLCRIWLLSFAPRGQTDIAVWGHLQPLQPLPHPHVLKRVFPQMKFLHTESCLDLGILQDPI